MTFFVWGLSIICFITLAPNVLLILEIITACIWQGGRGFDSIVIPDRLAVIIPAHNEENGIAITIRGLQTQLRESDRLIVVADNCDDNTAVVAANCGAEVVERNDLSKIGKGFALQKGYTYLVDTGGADVVIFSDADCMFADKAIMLLGSAAISSRNPVQAVYTIDVKPSDSLKVRVAAMAWRLKNKVRPIGVSAMGIPCHLNGAGMAFNWNLLKLVDLANSHLAEDTKLGLELALLGHPPIFCEEATVSSTFAPTEKGRSDQRARWQHGQISLIREMAPRLFLHSVRSLDTKLACLALDLCVMPLTLGLPMMFLWTFVFALLAVYADLFIAKIAFNIIFLFSLSVGLSLFMYWHRFCQDLLSFREIAKVPAILLLRIPKTLVLIFKRQGSWKRAERK